jgi:hypothetical protein
VIHTNGKAYHIKATNMCILPHDNAPLKIHDGFLRSLYRRRGKTFT